MSYGCWANTIETAAFWEQDRRRLVLDWNGPVVLLAPAQFGVERLIGGLDNQKKLLKVRLEEDGVAQTLAEVLNQVLDGPLIPQGASLGQVLEVMRYHLPLLDCYTLAVWASEAGPWLEKLLALQPPYQVVIWLECPDWETTIARLNLPKSTLVLTPEVLKLDLREAKKLTLAWLGDHALSEAVQRTGGALETFLSDVQHQLGQPLPMPQDFPEHLDPLIENGKWMKALERTCKVFPEGVPWLLEHIGPQLGAVGQWDKMAKLFSGLPRRVRQSERVLQWRLECALELSQGPNLLREVEAFLAQHEAPELRALYGQLKYRLGDPEASLRETERAVKAWESVRTLYYYGLALSARNIKHSEEILMKVMRLAEKQGNFYWAAKIASALSAQLNGVGDYRGAASWGEWAVRDIDSEGINNSYIRSKAVNEWAFGRLMAGEIIGAEARLRETIKLNTDLNANGFLMATLGDVLLVDGRALEAATYYRQLWENQSDRSGIAARTDFFVRCLIELGQLDEAQAVAEQSIKLSEENPLVFNRRAKLALGMVLALRAPGRAIQVLEGVFRELKEPLLAWRYVQAGLYLARAYQSLGDLLMARQVIEELRPHLDSIGATGLYYLCGPAHLFQDIVGWIRGGLPRLELRLLGRPEVRLDGKLLNLGQRSQEILALLALNLEGLNLDQLAVALYGDGADKAKAKMNLYALKKQVLIEGYPYRLGLSVWADFLEVPRLVREGKLREAIGLAKGPLLPDSEAPPLVEQRDYLNELLRQAALQDEDLEARLVLAERAQDDLEMWEASLSVMPLHDPRRLDATAKVGTLVANY